MARGITVRRSSLSKNGVAGGDRAAAGEGSRRGSVVFSITIPDSSDDQTQFLQWYGKSRARREVSAQISWRVSSSNQYRGGQGRACIICKLMFVCVWFQGCADRKVPHCVHSIFPENLRYLCEHLLPPA